MDLYIRSQDKIRIIKFDNVYIYNNKNGRYINKFEIRAIVFENTSIILGEYKTQKRCLQILDEIQSFFEPLTFTECGSCPIDIYQMPEE